MIGALSGIPGLLTISSAFKMSASVCCPSSQRIPWLSSISLYLGLIDDLSDTNTSNPFAFAKTAAPAPLSPAPNITILLLIFYLIFNVTIVITAKIIPINQKRTTIFDSGTTLNGFWINACIPAFPGFWK